MIRFQLSKIGNDRMNIRCYIMHKPTKLSNEYGEDLSPTECTHIPNYGIENIKILGIHRKPTNIVRTTTEVIQ